VPLGGTGFLFSILLFSFSYKPHVQWSFQYIQEPGRFAVSQKFANTSRFHPLSWDKISLAVIAVVCVRKVRIKFRAEEIV
jgi:hypothetical protein